MGDDYEPQARAIWDALARGRVDAVGALLDDDVEWRTSGGEVLRGPAGIAAYLERNGDSVAIVAHDFERHGDCVLVHGSLRRFRDGGFLDVQPSWVYFFRDGRIVGGTAFGSRAEALAAIAEYQRREPSNGT